MFLIRNFVPLTVDFSWIKLYNIKVIALQINLYGGY